MKKIFFSALQASSLATVFLIFLFSVGYFLVLELKTLKSFLYEVSSFLANFGEWKIIATLLIYFVGIGMISYYFLWKIHKNMEEQTANLKDYNHYLAHELKTPISVVLSHLDILEFEFDEARIKNSKSELKQTVKIIDSLLSFSESVTSLNKKDINVENFIRKIASFDIDKVNIENKEFNLILNTDELLFERIIRNLIENALKYSIDGHLLIHIKNDKLIFQNGIHKTLNSYEIENVLSKFHTQAYGSDNGHGLGLSLISEIVKSLGFVMVVKSENNAFIVEIQI